MKIQVCSDLHLEFGDLTLTNTENVDVLILSGDIMLAQDLHDHPEPASAIDRNMVANSQGMGRRQAAAQCFRDFLKRVSFQYPHVVYVAGNHEYYHSKFPDAARYLKEECDRYGNVHFLELDQVTIDDVTFVGGTLWTDFNKADPVTLNMIGSMMNDFNIVRNSEHNYTKFRPAHALYHHRKTLDYIKEVVETNPEGKFVVVGHHSPSTLSIHERYRDDRVMNGGYSSDLSEFILGHPQIKLWTHGHTHFPFDYTVGETRIVCNPRGYIGYEPEASTYDPNKIVEV